MKQDNGSTMKTFRFFLFFGLSLIVIGFTLYCVTYPKNIPFKLPFNTNASAYSELFGFMFYLGFGVWLAYPAYFVFQMLQRNTFKPYKSKFSICPYCGGDLGKGREASKAHIKICPKMSEKDRETASKMSECMNDIKFEDLDKATQDLFIDMQKKQKK